MRNKPLYPLQPLWDSVVARCHSGFNMGRQLAIDEAMVQYSGFKAKVRKFFMPLKPIRAGFKIYAITDSATGYIYNFIVHPYKGGKPAKMTDIAMEVVEPHIFTDKLYTAVELARRLLSKKTYLTGAVKSTSKGLPTDFSSSQQKNPHHHQKMKRLNKMARGTFYSRQNGQITCVLWKDSRVMPLLSTAHQGYRYRIQDTLSRKVQDSMGRRKATIIPAPRQAVDYTKHMGGVDRGDQLRSYYTCSRKSQYWWRKLMYFLVDICRVNAWISYRHHHPLDGPASSEGTDIEDILESHLSTKRSHAKFVMDVAKGLIDGFSKGSVLPQSNTRPLPSQSLPSHRRQKMPGKYANKCKQCSTMGRKNPANYNPFTRHGCIVCNVNLCQGRCFLEFHGATPANH